MGEIRNWTNAQSFKTRRLAAMHEPPTALLSAMVWRQCLLARLWSALRSCRWSKSQGQHQSPTGRRLQQSTSSDPGYAVLDKRQPAFQKAVGQAFQPKRLEQPRHA